MFVTVTKNQLLLKEEYFVKKAFYCLLIAVLVVPTLSMSRVKAAKAPSQKLLTEVVTSTDTHQKLKVTNTDTGEVQYLESIKKKDGSTIFKSTANGETKTISKKGEKVIVKDENGQVDEEVNVEDLGSSDKKVNSIGVMPQIIPSGGGGDWEYIKTYKHSISWKSTVVTTVAGVIAAAVSAGAATSIFITVASTAVNEGVPHYYMITSKYKNYSDPTRIRTGYGTEYYKYYDYTNYAGYTWSVLTDYITPGP